MVAQCLHSYTLCVWQLGETHCNPIPYETILELLFEHVAGYTSADIVG